MKFHDIANLFPMMNEEEYEALKKDISKNGLLEPITLYEGKILDGRNRYKACIELGFEPKYRDFDGDNPISYVVSLNLNRRHLTASQRAALALEILPMLEKEAKKRQAIGHFNAPYYDKKSDPEKIPELKKGESREQAAAIVGVNYHYVQDAKKIAQERPELIDKVRKGEVTISKAIKEIKIEQAKKKVETEYLNEGIRPIIYPVSNNKCDIKCDLLITDPPYMTDVDNINEFAKWLPEKLKLVKETGFAFVFIGAYPEELRAYLNVAMPDQVLVWTYKNTLGQNPKDRYKLNWQAILFYRMSKAPALNCPLTSEQWTVQEVNAPDGRMGDRYHTWQKPVELAERLIRHTTKKDDVVLDVFAGTGTFLLAASRLGRKAVGYEKDSQMVEIAERRGCKIGRISEVPQEELKSF